MRKNVIKLLLVVCLLCSVVLAVTACKGVKMTISFVVDGETYATIDTSGNEIVTIPQSPTKDGYTFDGWYWDVGTWQRPFTANSLLNEPLTSNMSVYAKFSIIHNHVLTLQPAVKADCEHVGNDVYYTCTCGKLFADAQATVELTAIPTINKTEHTPTDWIVDSKATCTADGSKHIECAVCHTTLQTQAIPSNGHTPETEWIIDKTAMCTVDGSKHLECSVCHATLQTSVIPATGHSYSTEWSKDEHGHWHVATCEHTSETTAIKPHTYDSNYKCKICSYQDTSLHGTEIATDVFTVGGETLYAKVPNAQTTFSFINAIQVADGATFVVATDLAASNVIRTKTVSLEIGDNTYYILVENGNDIKLYTVTLRRRPIYTVTVVTNGGTACVTQQVEEDSLATEPIASKTGYTFANWDYDFATPVTQSTTITASWTANEYTVTCDVNGGVLTDTQFTVTYDSAYTLAVPTREGHTFRGWYVDDTQITSVNGKSLDTWTYAEDKTATAKWSVDSYSLTITNPNSNAGKVTGNGTYIYSNEVTVTASEPNLGYEWLGWYDGDELLCTELTYTFNMPAKNLTLTPYKVKDEMSNFKFTSTTTTCTITGANKTVTEIVIPDYVTSIGDSAFQSCTNLTSVTIPNGITSIGYDTFCGCSSLTNITIPDSVKSIGAGAFSGSGLTSITIPCNVYSIGNVAFSNCSNLETVYWNATNCTNVGSSDYSIFKNCTKISKIVIGENVAKFPSGAFMGFGALSSVNYLGTIESWCNIQGLSYLMEYGTSSKTFSLNGESVTELVIPNTVTSIPSYAFYNCTNITSITFEDNSQCESIGRYAFYSCSSLTSVTIPNSVTSIGDYAFSGCGKLQYNEYDNAYYLGNDTNKFLWLIIAKYTITSCTVNENTKFIYQNAFSNCSSLKSITIPFVGASKDGRSNTHFGYIFGAGSYSNNSRYVPSSLKTVVITGENSIADRAFYNCSNIISVTIPNSVTSIGYQAFYNCSSLANINYLGTIETWFNIQGLYNLMQYDTSSKTFSLNGVPVKELLIPNTVTSIPSYAFYKCANITSVTFEENSQCTSISYSAFYNCSSLTSITIPNSVTSIGSDAFKSCGKLTSITIPDSVKSVNDEAFKYCSKLANINYLGTIESWCNIQGLYNLMEYGTSSKTLVIDGIEIKGDLVIPNAVTFIPSGAFEFTNITSVTFEENSQCTSIGYSAFYNCSSLTSINIPDNVIGIGSNAFYNCSSLTSITIPNSVTSIGNGAFYGCSSLQYNSYHNAYYLGNDSNKYVVLIKATVTHIIYCAVNENTKVIYQGAFKNCSSLESITIPDSVTNIGDDAFYGCNKLKTIYYKGDVDQWANISIGSYNNNLTSAMRYYFSETEPALNADGTAYDDNYWYYNDNHEAVVWEYNKENN